MSRRIGAARDGCSRTTLLSLCALACCAKMRAAGAAPLDEIVIVERSAWALLPWLINALLVIVLALLVVRRRDLRGAGRRGLGYRVLLGVLAGGLSGWIYELNADWLFGLPGWTGLLVPGALFGLLVLSPLLTDPMRHPVRAAVLVATGAMAHFAAWFVGLSLFDALTGNADDAQEQLLILAGLFAGPAFCVFGVLTGITVWRVAALRPTAKFWSVLLLGGWASGWLYQAAVLNTWQELLGPAAELHDYDIHLAYMLWFAVASLTFHLMKPQPLRSPSRWDMVLSVGLLLGWAWLAWTLGSGGI